MTANLRFTSRRFELNRPTELPTHRWLSAVFERNSLWRDPLKAVHSYHFIHSSVRFINISLFLIKFYHITPRANKVLTWTLCSESHTKLQDRTRCQRFWKEEEQKHLTHDKSVKSVIKSNILALEQCQEQKQKVALFTVNLFVRAG